MRTHAVSPIWLALDSHDMSGLESHVLSLAVALYGSGHPVEVLLLSRNDELHPLQGPLQLAGIRLHTCADTQDLFQLLQRQKPRLLHTHGYRANLLGRLFAPLLGIPLVCTFHETEGHTGMKRFYHWLDRQLPTFGIRTAVNATIADRLPGRCAVVSSLVALTEEGHERRISYPLAYVGYLSAEKGAERFCELMDELPGEVMGHLFGEGPLQARLVTQYSRKSRCHGLVPMAAIWPRIGLLCLPSTQRGMPFAALEAMARGIPVAAFAVGELPTLIRHGVNGFLVPPCDMRDMQAALGSWLAMPETRRQAMGEAARQTIRERFSIETVLPRLLNVYAQAGYQPQNQPQPT